MNGLEVLDSMFGNKTDSVLSMMAVIKIAIVQK